MEHSLPVQDFDLTAIPFIQDGNESYFDTDGNSLRKAFLKAPLKFSRISSRYHHQAVCILYSGSEDLITELIMLPRSEHLFIQSVMAGSFLQHMMEGTGRMVKISITVVYSTAYLHLSRFGEGITPGVIVKQGDIIGYVGSSGLSTGPHLDFRFYQNGSPVDPLKVDAPPVEPVSEENRERFEKIKKVNLNLLEHH